MQTCFYRFSISPWQMCYSREPTGLAPVAEESGFHHERYGRWHLSLTSFLRGAGRIPDSAVPELEPCSPAPRGLSAGAIHNAPLSRLETSEPGARRMLRLLRRNRVRPQAPAVRLLP